MNKNFLEHYMKTKPETTEQKYLFLVDNQEIAYALLYAGYPAIYLTTRQEAYHSTDSFIEYMDEIACTGTYQMDYVYVPACSSKKINDSLELYLQNNYLTYRMGWILFKEREYLAKPEYLLELKAVILDFINRFEGRSSDQPDLNKFHRFNDQGKRIGVFDMEIVDYLIQTVPFFMLGSTPYIYENGYYHEDRHGIQLKSHIQKLIFRDCIKATTIQSIYNLLVSQPQVQKRFSDLNNQPSHWVNFQNGYFDVMEWKLIEHDIKYLMINQIPFSYNP